MDLGYSGPLIWQLLFMVTVNPHSSCMLLKPSWLDCCYDLRIILTLSTLSTWDKAQRESAQRRKSDWGENLWGAVKFSQQQSHMARTQMHWYTQNTHCRPRVGQHDRL